MCSTSIPGLLLALLLRFPNSSPLLKRGFESFFCWFFFLRFFFHSKNVCFLLLFYARFVFSSVGWFVLFRVIISIWCCFFFRRRTMVACPAVFILGRRKLFVRRLVVFFLFNLILSSRVVWTRKKTFAAARLHCLQITVKDFHLTLYGFFLFSRKDLNGKWFWRGTGTVAGPKMRVHVPRTRPCVCESQKLQSGCVHL